MTTDLTFRVGGTQRIQSLLLLTNNGLQLTPYDIQLSELRFHVAPPRTLMRRRQDVAATAAASQQELVTGVEDALQLWSVAVDDLRQRCDVGQLRCHVEQRPRTVRTRQMFVDPRHLFLYAVHELNAVATRTRLVIHNNSIHCIILQLNIAQCLHA